MTMFKFHISTQVDVPDVVLQEAGKRLKNYFDRTCLATKPQKYTGSVFTLNPHNGQVGSKDLLCYITQASMILRIFPDAKRSGRGGGATVETPSGLLSEVYWTGGLQAVGSSAKQGIALANLVFHEFAHNKHLSDKRALDQGERNGGVFVHTACGGGIFSAAVNYKISAISDANPDNIKAMARVLDNDNKQYPFGLFDDDFGF